MASYASTRNSALFSVVSRIFSRRVDSLVIGPSTVALNSSWNGYCCHSRRSIANSSHTLRLTSRCQLPAMDMDMNMDDSVPVVRDFQSTRTRSATAAAPSIPKISLDLTTTKGPRRHSTLAPPGTDRGRSTSCASSLSEPMSPLHRRITRQNTVRNYHSPSRPTWEEPGAEPGIDTSKEPEPHFGHLIQECQITVVDFSDERMSKYEMDNEGLVEFLEDPREDWVACRWINVNGLSWDVIKELGNKHGLHRLAIEDLMNTRGRTKADWYSDHAFSKCLSFSVYHIKRVFPLSMTMCYQNYMKEGASQILSIEIQSSQPSQGLRHFRQILSFTLHRGVQYNLLIQMAGGFH
jgi:hypothetical protein